MSALNIQLLFRRSIDFPELAIFASRPGAMINLHWLELPMARTLFHGPKGVRVHGLSSLLENDLLLKEWTASQGETILSFRVGRFLGD